MTSGGYGYAVQLAIAYGYVPTARARPGTLLTVELFGEAITAEVRAEPPYDPRRERLRA